MVSIILGLFSIKFLYPLIYRDLDVRKKKTLTFLNWKTGISYHLGLKYNEQRVVNLKSFFKTLLIKMGKNKSETVLYYLSIGTIILISLIAMIFISNEMMLTTKETYLIFILIFLSFISFSFTNMYSLILTPFIIIIIFSTTFASVVRIFLFNGVNKYRVQKKTCQSNILKRFQLITQNGAENNLYSIQEAKNKEK